MPEFANYDYKWVTDPPVAAVAPQTFLQLNNTLSSIAGNFEGDTAVLEAGRQTTIGDKAKACTSICGQIKDCVEEKVMEGELGNYEFFAYTVSGMPVALLMLKIKTSPLFIEYVVSHPTADSGGTIMIEYAVNLSADRGSQGKVALEATKSAKGFYLGKCGFTQKPSGEDYELILDPAARGDLWELLMGKWRLKSELPKGEKFLSTTAKT